MKAFNSVRMDVGCRVVVGLLTLMLMPSVGYAGRIVFEGGAGTTTGELIHGASNVWTTVDVAEFAGLEISARSGDAGHTLVADGAGFFGLTSGLENERDNAFDVGETLVLKFDQPVRIDLLDFNLFEKEVGDLFSIQVAGQAAINVGYDDLDNKTSDYIGFDSGISVAANTEVEFYVSSGQVGLDAMELTVIPEPLAVGLIGFVGIGMLVARRFVV